MIQTKKRKKKSKNSILLLSANPTLTTLTYLFVFNLIQQNYKKTVADFRSQIPADVNQPPTNS